MVKSSTSGEGAIFQSQPSIWSPLTALEIPGSWMEVPGPTKLKEWKGEDPPLPSSFLLISRGATQHPVPWLTLWAMTPGVHGQGPKSITSSLSYLSSTWLLDPKKHLPALFSGKPSSYIQTNLHHPPYAVNRGHENDCFFKRLIPRGIPTKCNSAPSPHWLTSICLQQDVDVFSIPYQMIYEQAQDKAITITC